MKTLIYGLLFMMCLVSSSYALTESIGQVHTLKGLLLFNGEVLRCPQQSEPP